MTSVSLRCSKNRVIHGGTTVVCLFLFALLIACAAGATENTGGRAVPRFKSLDWQEQVRFSTEKVIVVRRGERRRVLWEWGKPGLLFYEAWLEADLPNVGHARWEGSLDPLVLDVTPAGEWYLLGVTIASKGHKDYSLPENKRYVAFKWFNGAWQRVPFVDFPERFKPNLLADTTELIWGRGIAPGVIVTFEMKQQVDSNPQLGRALRTIDRSLGE